MMVIISLKLGAQQLAMAPVKVRTPRAYSRCLKVIRFMSMSVLPVQAQRMQSALMPVRAVLVATTVVAQRTSAGLAVMRHQATQL